MNLAFIPPGEAWKNGYVESFHSRQRDEFLNITTFATLLHARVELTALHRQYNHVRRHSSLGYKTPTEYAETYTCTHTTDSQSDRTANRGQATWKMAFKCEVNEMSTSVRTRHD